ncbi:cilium assembly protein DZIP1 isoform X2 [Eublepharis macularius]|uniref:Cilium assembly protein DZIP1 isoform X2 n=1 Tax=Eublepharis macularius TaxID=481883 RepID=A0AA97J4P3_EUBMA|nr:cilium assembly protein DZIP1 isoform X2 [Eublepharis macularius]
MAASAAAALPPFQFRPRHDSPDWRRLSAVDVARVAAEMDVAALQEHLEHVTFCNAERERCPHCQAPADPLLLRLLRLAQLCLEYLLRSQDYLAAQLRAQQEALRSADAHRQQLARDLAAKDQLARTLKDECKRRRKMISTQQMMLQAGAAYHQCQFCEKSFVNYSFLHNHLQRRHAEESHSDQKKKAQADKLQAEIDKLKDQLQLTKSQLEAEQRAHAVKLAKEYEEHRSKEEEIRHLFHKWKEEEKEKLATELEKVKEMFMKEFKELTAKNTELENHLVELQKSNKHLKSNLGTLKDSYEFTEEKPRNAADDQNVIQLLERQESKWASQVQTLQEEHENEKHQLLSQIEKLKASVTEDLNASNAFYKKRIEELGQRLQEQNELIITQKHQIQKLATRSVESIKLSDAKASAQNAVLPKSSLPSAHGRQRVNRIGGSLSTVLPKPAKRSFAKRPIVQRKDVAENTSTPKVKKSVLGDNISRKPLSITTPPFSSDDEVDDDDIMQSYISPELAQPRAPVSGSKNTLARLASQSDINSLEEDEVEEIQGNLKSSHGAVIQKGAEQVEKTTLCQAKESQSAGGINVAPILVQKSTQGVKFTGVVDDDEDDWDFSSLEEENPLPTKVEKVKNGAVSMVHPFGKLTKEEGLQDADTTSTLKSSLVTVTDWSDSSDI